MRRIGDVFPVTQAYLAWHEEKAAHEKQHRQGLSGTSGLYRVRSLRLTGHETDESGEVVIPRGGDLRVELDLYSPDGRPPVALFGLMKGDGTGVYGVASDYAGVAPEQLDEHHFRFRLDFDGLPLLPGAYCVWGHAMDPEAMRLCDKAEVRFHVSGESREMGMVYLSHRWVSPEDDGSA